MYETDYEIYGTMERELSYVIGVKQLKSVAMAVVTVYLVMQKRDTQMSSIEAEKARKVLKQFLAGLGWAGFVVKREVKSRVLRWKRLFVRPRLPNNPHGKILIHLGCGDVNSPEFINVDCRPAPHVHFVCDVTDLSIFRDEYADLVYACHILEHIPRANLKKTLLEWRRILKPNGILRLAVPDFDVMVEIYRSCSNDIQKITGPLMGGQDYKENLHYSVFNSQYLISLLTEVGFRNVRQWDPREDKHHEFEDWASRPIIVEDNKFHISLNLEAAK